MYARLVSLVKFSCFATIVVALELMMSGRFCQKRGVQSGHH